MIGSLLWSIVQIVLLETEERESDGPPEKAG